MVVSNQERQRILFFSDCPGFGGSEKILVELLHSDEIHRRYDVVFVYGKSLRYETEVVQNLDSGIRTLPVRIISHQQLMQSPILKRLPNFLGRPLRYLLYLTSANPVYDFMNYRAISRALRKLSPNLIHVNNGGWPGSRSALLACIAASEQSIPVLLHVHNMAYQRPVSPYVRHIDKKTIKSCRFIVCVSQVVKNSLVMKRSVPEEKLVVVSNTAGREVEEFRLRRPVKKRNAVDREFLVVALGALEKRKGFDVLIEAMSIIGSMNVQVRCEIYGHGSLKTVLQNRIVDLGIRDVVALNDFTSESTRVIWNADLLVQPARAHESFGLTVVEALVLSTSVIATRVGGMPEVLDEGKCGLIVNPCDAQALAEAVTHLYREPDERKRLCSEGQERYWSKYSYGTFIEQVLHLYDKLVDEDPNDMRWFR